MTKSNAQRNGTVMWEYVAREVAKELEKVTMEVYASRCHDLSNGAEAEKFGHYCGDELGRFDVCGTSGWRLKLMV
jgi:hypothetical protein